MKNMSGKIKEQQYFVYWMPVEGDITDGNRVMFKLKRGWTEPCEFDSMLGPEVLDVRQGKLMLCSKDVRVGDKVMVVSDRGLVSEYEWLIIDQIKDKYNQDKFLIRSEDKEAEEFPHDLFRVIGEISPGVRWLKGKEYLSAEEVSIKGTEPDNYHSLKLILELDGPHSEPKEMYYVDCPTCKTPH